MTAQSYMHEPDVQLSRRALMGWLVGGAAFAATNASPAYALLQAAEPFPALRAFISDYVSSRRLPGAMAAIGRGNGALQTVAAGTIANDSSVRVDADTLWRLYSQTKPITGIAVMMLVEQRRLTLDTPIAEFLPRFADVRVLIRPDAPISETVALATPITVRHLITHTSGLGYGLSQRTPLEREWVTRNLVPGQVSRLSVPGIPSGRTRGPLAAWADAVAELPLVAQPGTRWTYSAGLDLAGRLIEVVSGMPFDRFLKDRLFDPLGMTSTGFQVASANVPRLATNYAPVGGALFPIDPAGSSIYRDAPSFPFGGAGLVGSARDYDRFLAMLLGEGRLGRVRVLSRDTARLAMSNLLPAGVSLENPLLANNGFGAGGRVSLPGSPGGAGLFGWGGAAGTIGVVHRGLGIRFGGYANYMPSEAYDFQRRIVEVALTDFARR
jgi:CubicO group peptidase (beta-lactamase class C family)